MARLLGLPRIAMAHAVYARYATAGGPILARGLAFVALFALVPALLVVVSIVGSFARDATVRDEVIALVSAQLPPLAPLIGEALDGAGNLAAPSGLLGLALLVWTASSLVRALDGAFRLVFDDAGPGRTPLRDLVAAASVAGGTLAAALVLVLLAMPTPLGDALGAPSPAARGILSIAAVGGIVALAYRFTPRPRPSWRSLGLPAALVGLGVFILTALFAFLGPLLFGAAQLYGAFGALFAGLLWLGAVTQLLVLGAAWVAERDRRARRRSTSAGEAPGS